MTIKSFNYKDFIICPQGQVTSDLPFIGCVICPCGQVAHAA